MGHPSSLFDPTLINCLVERTVIFTKSWKKWLQKVYESCCRLAGKSAVGSSRQVQTEEWSFGSAGNQSSNCSSKQQDETDSYNKDMRNMLIRYKTSRKSMATHIESWLREEALLSS